MRRSLLLTASLFAGVVTLWLTPSAPTAAIEHDGHVDDVPVLLELFTSEGCSSCPPADEVLARLERTQPIAGVQIVPLAFHVDYWDVLGWPDPFALSASTARQRAYAPLGGGTYTPQAVIDGRAQVVGSRVDVLQGTIDQAAHRSHVAVGIDVRPLDGGFDVAVHVGALPVIAGSAPDDAEVLLAVTQSTARVAVPRGENAGKTLEHTAIVRDLWSPVAVGSQGGTTTFSLRTPYRDAEAAFRLVAFVQRRGDRAVLGSQTRSLCP